MTVKSAPVKKVEVVLYASLQKYKSRIQNGYSIENQISVGDILVELGIPEDYVGLVFIDNKRSQLDSVLEGGEKLSLFPPIGGG